MHSPLASSAPRQSLCRPAGCASRAPRAQPRALHAPAACQPACLPAGQPACLPAGLPALLLRSARPCRAHLLPAPACPCACYAPVSRASASAARPAPPARAPAALSVPSCLVLQSQYNFCTAIQFLSLTQLPQSRYKNCIVTHCLFPASLPSLLQYKLAIKPATKLYCNTISSLASHLILQYTPCLAIQFLP